MTLPKQIPIIPNGLRYWVLPKVEEKTSVKVGDYTLTETADKDKPPLEGVVVAVGDAESRTVADGISFSTTRTCKYHRGDELVYGAYAGQKHTFEGVDYTILHEDEVLGRVITTPFDPEDPTDLTAQ